MPGSGSGSIGGLPAQAAVVAARRHGMSRDIWTMLDDLDD